MPLWPFGAIRTANFLLAPDACPYDNHRCNKELRAHLRQSSHHMEATDQITQLLVRIDSGDSHAAEALFPLVYEQLRARAGQLMASERRDHTLQRTALVHEAYLRLVNAGCTFESRLHFLNAAALAMRRSLANHARDRGRLKRGGDRGEVDLSSVPDADAPIDQSGIDQLDWMALDEALEKLAALSPRQAQVVNLRYFAGLKDAQIAELLKISEPTVRRDWATARPWLYRHMRAAP
jgi:RNA polymerase sigma factor (TIGR02999 family)